MKIETKYNIGDRFWIVYEPTIRDYNDNLMPGGEVSVYDTKIMNILITEDGLYYEPEADTAGIKEEDIILYNDKEKLLQKILEVMENIHKRESEEQ